MRRIDFYATASVANCVLVDNSKQVIITVALRFLNETLNIKGSPLLSGGHTIS